MFGRNGPLKGISLAQTLFRDEWPTAVGRQPFDQGYTYVRVSQYVVLTYIAVAAVALAAYRYGRPDLIRRRALVLAHV